MLRTYAVFKVIICFEGVLLLYDQVHAIYICIACVCYDEWF